MWFLLLGFEEDKRLPKSPLICCEHFESNDFIVKPSGMRILKKEAVPLPFHSGSQGVSYFRYKFGIIISCTIIVIIVLKISAPIQLFPGHLRRHLQKNGMLQLTRYIYLFTHNNNA